MNASKCSSWSVVPSYQSMFKGFHPRGRGASRILLKKGCRLRNLIDCLLDLWLDRPTIFVWQLVSCEECFSYAATLWFGTVYCVFACDCCNYTWMTSFSWYRACISTSCFCHNATISFAFFFCRASNCYLNPCVPELPSMVVDLNVELLVATIYFCDWRKFHSGPTVSAKRSHQILLSLICE